MSSGGKQALTPGIPSSSFLLQGLEGGALLHSNLPLATVGSTALALCGEQSLRVCKSAQWATHRHSQATDQILSKPNDSPGCKLSLENPTEPKCGELMNTQGHWKPPRSIPLIHKQGRRQLRDTGFVLRSFCDQPE